MQQNNYPKLHNATWPGIVGKGPDSEPPISLDTLLELTANAEVNGVKFDGIDIGLFAPHFDLDSSDEPILPSILTVPFDSVDAINTEDTEAVCMALLNIVLSSALGV